MRKPLLALIIFFSLFILTMNSLHGDFFTVDDSTLISIPQLRSPLNFQLVKTIFTPGNHIDYYPIRDLSYWIDIHLLGADANGAEGFIFRVHNLVLLALSSTLVCWILELLGAVTVALPIALVWAFLPIHWETMIWASARKDILAITFTLCSCAFFIKSVQTNKLKWQLLSIAAFTLGLLSKVSFGFLISAFIGIAFSAYQSWFYSHINDMRFFYTPSYRIQASAAALGKMTIGTLIPSYHIIDLENWGTWLNFNHAFIPIGILLWFCILAGLTYSLIKKNKLIFVTLFTFSMLYLPIASLVFPHRNFYSMRYFEAPLLSLFICSGLFLKKIKKEKAYITLVPIIFLVTTASLMSSKNWASSIAIIKHSLAQEPNNPSFLSYQYSELSTTKRWGKLTSQELIEMEAIPLKLDHMCNEELEKYNPNGSLCFNYWIHAPEIKQQNIATFNEWDLYLNHIQHLNKERLNKQKLNAEYAKVILNSKKNPDLFNSWLKENPYQTDENVRINYWYSLCNSGKLSEASVYLENAINDHLIDKVSFINASKKSELLNQECKNQILQLVFRQVTHR